MSGIRPGSGFWGCPTKETLKWYGKKAAEATGIGTVAVGGRYLADQYIFGLFGEHVCQEVNSTLVNTTVNNATYIFNGETMYLAAGYASGIGIGGAVATTLFLYAAVAAIKYQFSEKSSYEPIQDPVLGDEGLNTPRDNKSRLCC